MKGLRYSEWGFVIIATMSVAIFGGWASFIHNADGIRSTPDGLDVDLEKLGSFNFDQRWGTLNDIPLVYRRLDGKRVTLEGFMWASSGADKISGFQFVDSIVPSPLMPWGPPLIQQRVFVTVADHGKVSYFTDEVRIVGELHVDISRDESGRVIKLFSMDLDHIEQL